MLIGVVGKPNVGKSTFFKAATLAEVEIANYPFATVKPNSGVGYVKVGCVCRDFGVQCTPREGFALRGKRFVPVQMMDVAGLVPGAHEGKGMGNQFLDDLRQADVLVHVIDCSGGTSEAGEPVKTGSYDPTNDVRFLEHELDMWYLQIIRRGWDRFARTVMQEHGDIKKALSRQLSGLKVSEEMVDEAVHVLGLPAEKPGSWTEDSLVELSRIFRRKTKPMIIACNKIDVQGASENLERLRAEFPETEFFGCSSESELALREASKKGLIDYVPGGPDFRITCPEALSDSQKKGLGFIRENVLQRFGSTGVQGVLDSAVFDLLGYIAVFPGGVGKLQDSQGRVIPDCFLMPRGSTALDFAYRLHTDFGDNFIRAVDVRTKMAVGKDHPLKHRDVIEIISGRR